MSNRKPSEGASRLSGLKLLNLDSLGRRGRPHLRLARRQRRLMVLGCVITAALFATALTLWMHHDLTGGALAGVGRASMRWILSSLLLGHFLLMVGLASSRVGLSDAPLSLLDERQAKLNVLAHRRGHTINTVVLLSLGVYALLASSGALPSPPAHYLSGMLVVVLAGLLSFMPILWLAWTEPDALHDPL